MCGRFVSASSPALIAEHLHVDVVDASVGEAHEPDYNVAPRAEILAVREREGRRVLSRLRWGFVPSWAKDPAVGDRMINARAERLTGRSAFERAFERHRCLIPADGFYEWRVGPAPSAGGRRRREPVFVHRRDGQPLTFAGLWAAWRVPEDQPGLASADGWLRSCVIITTTANTLLAPIHDRMPVVLPEPAWRSWLDPDEHDVDKLLGLLVPAPDADFDVYAVSTRVNSARNNGPELVRRLGEDGRE
jgi:putative SOS response-associated peptidase YedK